MAQLQVTIIEGRNLKKKDLFSENDPFVQIYLDENQKQKTKVKHNSKNPTWNQIFVLYICLLFFSIELNLSIYFSNHFQGQDILHIDVYDEDTIKNDIIGSLTIDLQDLYEKRIYY